MIRAPGMGIAPRGCDRHHQSVGIHREAPYLHEATGCLLLASSPRRRKNAVDSPRGTSICHPEHRWDGHMGWRLFAMSISWEPYVWDAPHPVAPGEFESIERLWGVSFPAPYKSIVSMHQGMTPNPHIIDIGKGDSSICTFLTVSEDESSRTYSLRDAYNLLKAHIPPGVYPLQGRSEPSQNRLRYSGGFHPPHRGLLLGVPGPATRVAPHGSSQEWELPTRFR